ncbi:FKBP-type peptidyl-prolyl cis-trans isomerase [Parafilimonas sp.]|uniref:FKBP-type peptidyl-prolyl cis-trans isomerase n=1 Tax=Parafilimonas sp. TaxID=1969739 RepID=UPI0039E512D1
MNLQEKFKAMLQKNTREQEQFLQDNAAKEGVVTLPSGLQYTVVTKGKGDKPGPCTVVTVHYEGSLINGKVFDSSYKRGQPASFGVHQVIPGWTEALQLMPVGSKWKLFIPSALGYGARGAGGAIPPHATLVFDVELLNMR